MSFPDRINRTHFISEILFQDFQSKKEIVICGRVIGIIDGEGFVNGETINDKKGYILQDDSGRVFIQSEDFPKVGVILEVMVECLSNQFKEILKKFLVDCEDFYISLKESANYQKVIIDQKLKDNLIKRTKIIEIIRKFFKEEGFIETDTPSLVKLPGMEPYLDVFKTRFEADFAADMKVSEDMYLITSPEYAMKKLLVGGFEKIFQITKSFRNKETFSDRHNPEFTILEWYRAFASYFEMMSDTENLIKYLWKEFNGEDKKFLYWNEMKIDMTGPWQKIKVIEAFQKYANIDESTFNNVDRFREAVKKKGYNVDESCSFDDLFFMVFMNEIEGKLGVDVPTIIYDYPISMASLSKPCEYNENYAERFEAYIAGMEICNAFSELNNPIEQEKRLTFEREERKKLNKDLYDVDRSFIDALKMGMPPSGGNALGVDRIIMLLTGVNDIRDILFFPYKDL